MRPLKSFPDSERLVSSQSWMNLASTCTPGNRFHTFGTQQVEFIDCTHLTIFRSFMVIVMVMAMVMVSHSIEVEENKVSESLSKRWLTPAKGKSRQPLKKIIAEMNG